jgi:hypothetical protein
VHGFPIDEYLRHSIADVRVESLEEMSVLASAEDNAAGPTREGVTDWKPAAVVSSEGVTRRLCVCNRCANSFRGARSAIAPKNCQNAIGLGMGAHRNCSADGIDAPRWGLMMGCGGTC